MMDDLKQRLASLSPQELQTLDAAITPPVAAILSKAFPEVGAVFAQMQNPSAAPTPGASIYVMVH